MILIGLTGGIGSGKSTVARMLAAKGAIVLDADRIGHAVLAGPARTAVVEHFGTDVLAADGSIDRRSLAGLAFASPGARRDLEGLTHPHIFAEISRRVEAARREEERADEPHLVVLDAPLLVEALPDRGRSLGLKALVVVAAHLEDQIERAVEAGQMSDVDVKTRIAAQAPAAHKLAAADYVLDNRGSLEDLRQGVDVLWQDLTARFEAAETSP